jgi:WD40 repeat protein
MPWVSPAGKKVAFLESMWSDRGVTSGDVMIHDFSTGKTKNITASDPKSYSCVSWSGNDSFYTLSDSMGTFELTDFSNGKKVLWSGKGNVFPGFAPLFVTNRDRAFFVYSSSDFPPEIMGVDLKTGKSAKTTDVNTELDDLLSHTHGKQLPGKEQTALKSMGSSGVRVKKSRFLFMFMAAQHPLQRRFSWTGIPTSLQKDTPYSCQTTGEAPGREENMPS